MQWRLNEELEEKRHHANCLKIAQIFLINSWQIFEFLLQKSASAFSVQKFEWDIFGDFQTLMWLTKHIYKDLKSYF